MGAWGYGLFQSDADLDVMEEISDEAGKLAKDSNFTFWYPENEKEVVEKLNSGLYHQLLELFQKKWGHGVIYLTALTMQLGASISVEDLHAVRQTLTHTPMYDEAKAQMEKGLNGYKSDGEKWDFQSPGLVETANAASSNDQPGGKGFVGMNVFEDWNKRPKGMPGGPNDMDDPEKWKLPTEAKKKHEHRPTGSDNLSKKGMLKAWLDS